MAQDNFLQSTQKFELQAYKAPEDVFTLRKTHMPFSGSPRRHPYDSGKIILVIDPYGGNTVYYEFNRDDISYVEELPCLATLDGKTVTMARIWVKKMSVGLRATPFLVEEIGN